LESTIVSGRFSKTPPPLRASTLIMLLSEFLPKQFSIDAPWQHGDVGSWPNSVISACRL
jgi:hypothetical protein